MAIIYIPLHPAQYQSEATPLAFVHMRAVSSQQSQAQMMGRNMGRAIHRLTARKVQTAGDGMHADGGGLYLLSRAGARSWIFRFQLAGRRRDMGLGRFPDVSLQDARALAADARASVARGVDPLDARATQARTLRTWGDACADYIEAQRHGWRNEAQANQWTQSLADHGPDPEVPVADMTTDVVLSCLRRIWNTKTETASRLRGRIERVIDAERVAGNFTGENPARWRGHLQHVLPPPAKVGKAQHHAAMPWQDIPAFWRDVLMPLSCRSRAALAFTIMTAARTSEVTGAQWSEFSDDGTWTIPASRMKAGRPHAVPLSDAAKDILRMMAGTDAPFALSENTMLFLIQRQPPKGFGLPYTTHGFRSAFRDWCSEATDHPSEVAEMALAHAIRDKTEAAYRRGALLEKRRRLMQDWSDYCTGATR